MAHDTYASLIEGVMPPKMRDDVWRTEDAERAADELRQYEDRETRGRSSCTQRTKRTRSST
jgi:hypothetical protein